MDSHALSAGALRTTLGQSVHLTVRHRLGTQFQGVHLNTDSGVAQRLDFGIPIDSQGTGAPDVWQLVHLGGLHASRFRHLARAAHGYC